MDDLRDVALFVAVAKARNFTRAATTLGMPTSSLSRRIGLLEASLGVRLFNRNTRRVDLTEAGALYLVRAEGIVEAAREAHQQLRGLTDLPRGVLRVSAEAVLGPGLLAPLVAAFLERYPAVTLDLDLSPRRVDLLAENFDLAIRFGRLADSSLTVRRVAWLRTSLYAAPAYLARRGTPLHPRDLPGHARIHLLHQGDRGEWRLGDGAETVEVEAGSLVAANNMGIIHDLTRLGVGIGVLDEILAYEDLRSGTLLPVLPGWTLPPGPLSVLTPARLLPAKTRRFIEMLTQRLGALAAGS